MNPRDVEFAAEGKPVTLRSTWGSDTWTGGTWLCAPEDVSSVDPSSPYDFQRCHPALEKADTPAVLEIIA